MKKILFLSLFLLCTAMSAWSQTTNNVVLQFEDNTQSKTTNPETGIYVQGTPYTEENHSAWKVDGDNTLELSVPQGYFITKVEFWYSPFIEGDCIDLCDCLIPGTEKGEDGTWVQKDGKYDYYCTIKFNAKSPAYVSAVFVYYHQCSGATHHETARGTCTTKGKVEYWECTCGKIFSDANCIHEVTDMASLDTDIDPTNHADLEEHARVEATCIKDGIILYWHCNGCGKNFETKDAENEIADVTISKEQGSHLHPTYVEAKDATGTEIGYTVNHWHCQDCGKNFEDQECTKPITDDVIIPITGTLNYLCFTANAVGSTVELVKNGDAYNVILQYSTDYCKNWKSVDFEASSTTGTITLEKVNDKVYFRNKKPAEQVSGFSKNFDDGYNHYQFVMSGSIAASGNVMSLVDCDVKTEIIPADYCFANLFEECRALTSAPELPATILKEYCYYYMFEKCKALTSAPELPATTLEEGCYDGMFARCSSFTNAPKLPAMELKDNCYSYMFVWCTSLPNAPELPATTLAKNCYKAMFDNCTNLTKAPELPAVNLKDSCYYLMFDNCTSLTEAPALNAMNLAESCYKQMFFDCTGLKSAPALPATTLAEYCYYAMFDGCTNLKSAPALSAMTMKPNCYKYMFAGCTSLKTAPALPATTLAEHCYYAMFDGCTNLKSAPALSVMTMQPNCYMYMFAGCTSLETAPALPATTLAEYCYKAMFLSCKSLTEAPNLPATTLCTDCYKYMFERCTNLKSIKVGFTDWYGDATDDWLYETAADGIFICPDELSAKYDDEYGIPCNWTKVFEVKANNEPKTENYYATFYSGKNAYEVPEGVTAYTGKVDGSVLRLTPVADGIIPADEAVILKATQTQVYLPYTTETATKSDDNKLFGTDEATTLGTNDYALSYGQNGVGFYLWNGKSIDAHKAYLTLTSPAKAFTFEFNDEPSGIKETFEPYNDTTETYNLNGMRVGKDYKGIVVVRGKKYMKK